MKVLIVTESCFGNTSAIAEAIADGLAANGATVDRVDASQTPTLDGVDLLVVGAPTHAMGLPKQSTRLQAQAQGGRPATPGVAEWLATLPPQRERRAAVFSTVTGGFFSGSASKGIAQQLRRRSTSVVARTDFRVGGVSGPLADGETERARAWGASLV